MSLDDPALELSLEVVVVVDCVDCDVPDELVSVLGVVDVDELVDGVELVLVLVSAGREVSLVDCA